MNYNIFWQRIVKSSIREQQKRHTNIKVEYFIVLRWEQIIKQ